MSEAAEAPRSSEQAGAWTVAETRFDPACAKAYEGLFTLGSGYLHVRGSIEEHLSGQAQNVEYERRAGNVTSERFRDVLAQWGTYVPGVFARHPTLNNQMMNLPWPLGLAPVVDGERLDARDSEVLEWRRELCLRNAVLRRRVRWRTRSGTAVDAEFTRFVSAASPHLIVQRLTLTADCPCRVEVIAGIDADVRTNGFDHWKNVRTCAAAADGAMGELTCEVMTDAGDAISLRSFVWADPVDTRGTARRVEPEFVAGGERGCGVVVGAELRPGRPLVVHKRTWVSSGRDLDAGAMSVDGVDRACRESYDELLAAHGAEWSRRWDACDIEIDGDERSQLASRVAIFHLLRAHVPGDARVAIDAKGYAGEAYWGRYFWDTEVYLLPFYLYTRPEAARTLAEFRVRSLPGARRNAARYGYTGGGARYAWESDANGDECCPNWQYADHEVHVTADVAYGLAHYAAGAGDVGFLEGVGADVLVATARYWMERITFDDRVSLTRPRILGVMGPDEYKPITNDNAYTNRMVAGALRLAAERGGKAERGGGISEAERAAWRTVADRLPIVRAADGVLVLQCEGFDGFADPEFDRLWLDRDQTFAAQVSQERLYRSKCLKQADVLMLMALFPREFSDEEVRRAWDYYLPYTTHDSSLSAGAHCLVACRLGLEDEAWAFWLRGSRQDLPAADGGEGGAAEGIHIAGAGAVWQMAVLGFAGMYTAMQADELTLRPRLPRAWRALRFPIVWKGQAARVEIERGLARVSNRSGRGLAVTVRGERRVIAPGTTEAFP